MKYLRYSWRRFASAGPIVGLTFALASHAQSLPEGPGKADFQRTCSVCHSITVVTARRLSYSGWENVVEDMISRGAQAAPDEEKQIVRYLTANFGIGSFQSSAPESAVPEEAPVPAQTQAAPVLDASQKARAQELIRSSGCLSCHRIDGEGSYAGPYLGDVGENHTAEQIRSSLAYPSKELTPQNRSVRLITQEGKKVVGRLLNQDGFSVQLIDASGHLMTFERANLRNFTIITANSMPSYSDRMSPQDLSLLINYLESQTGTLP